MSAPLAQNVSTAPSESAIPANHARALRLWLGVVALLIVAMILVGGATRLTDSGLSITEWQPIVGAVPPNPDADKKGHDAEPQQHGAGAEPKSGV